jgi:hypothetical protein
VVIKAIQIKFSRQNKNILNIAGKTVFITLLVMKITGIKLVP